MTSKNSFWVSLRENNKRRIWLWLLSALIFAIAYPAVVAMNIGRGRAEETYLIESLGETLGREALYQNLISRMESCFGVDNYVLLAAVSAIAVVSAIQGFSYLYSRKKVDFYLGMPVKKSRRFAVIWLNGVMAYLFPALAGVLSGWLIAAGNGLLTAAIFKESVLAFLLMLCVYLGVYHLAILAVMLTGNVVITCFGTAVLCLYELAVRVLLAGYGSLFYKTFVSQDDKIIPLFSPFAIYAKYAEKYREGLGGGPLTAVSLLGFAAVIGLAAYFCYLKRPSEAAGGALAFKALQPVIKIMLAVPVTLLAGYLVADIMDYRPVYGRGSVGFVLFSMAVVLLVACCLIQVIYEFDIKGIFHKKRHILISAAIAAVVFLVFRFDVFGYDRYLPDAEKVSSAALITPYGYSYFGNGYFDEKLDYVSKDNFIEEHMYLTDIGAVNKLLKNSNDVIASCGDMSRLYDTADGEWYSLEVVYRMGGKRTVCRKIYVNPKDPETLELLDRITGSEEYIDGAYISMAETLDNILAEESNKVTAYYGTNIYDAKLSGQEASQLLSLYKEDIRESLFSERRSHIPAGSLRLSVEKRYVNYTSYRETEIRIYPFYTRCVEYLKEKGVYRENFLNPEDVERIQVTNYNLELREQAQGDAIAKTGYEPTAVEVRSRQRAAAEDGSEYICNAVYDEKEKIAAICEKLYPADWVSTDWSMDAHTQEGYSVTVYFTPEKSMNDMGVASFVFLEGEMPEFVREDTVKVE